MQQFLFSLEQVSHIKFVTPDDYYDCYYQAWFSPVSLHTVIPTWKASRWFSYKNNYIYQKGALYLLPPIQSNCRTTVSLPSLLEILQGSIKSHCLSQMWWDSIGILDSWGLSEESWKTVLDKMERFCWDWLFLLDQMWKGKKYNQNCLWDTV